MNNLMNYTSKNIRWFCLSILFINCIIISLFLNVESYIYDSNYYWSIADPVYNNGTYNILSFPRTFRGCIFPLLVLTLKIVFGGVWGWRVLSAVMVSLIFGVFLPKIMSYQITHVKDALRALVAEVIFLFVWGQFLQYPLSDLPAAFFLIAGVFFIILLQEFIDKKDTLCGSNIKKQSLIVIMGGVTGICLYTSYNCRVSFMYGAVISILAIFVKIFKQKRLKQLLCIFIGCIIGFFIAAYPQCVINLQNEGSFSPRVYTEAYTDYETSLQATQVLWGLTYPRYEGYIGDMEKYGSAGVYFDDVIGNRIISEENINTENFKITTIFSVFIKYPLDVIGIYTRHLVSLLTPAWNQVYITNIYTNKTFLVLMSIVIWLLAGLNLFSQVRNRKQNINIIYIISICVPAFLQLIGAPELRFFLPVYLLIYPYVCCKIDYSEIVAYVKEKWITLILVLIVITLLWITVFGDTLAMNREIPLLINDIKK